MADIILTISNQASVNIEVAPAVSMISTVATTPQSYILNTSMPSSTGGSGEGGPHSINLLTDVDISTDPVAKNDILMWNGTNFVPVVEGSTFTFSASNFSDGESTTQLIGSGIWKGNFVTVFAVTYVNGPPTTASVLISINGASYGAIGNMNSPAYTAGTNTSQVAYPTTRDHYLQFKLDVSDGTDAYALEEEKIYFRNYIYWGSSATGSSFSEANVEALAGSAISNVHTRTETIATVSSQYIVFAHPSSYTSIHADGFLFKGITCPFSAPETVSIENSAGYTEDYKVYASTQTNLSGGDLKTSTTATLTNKLYYGGSTLNTGWNEGHIKALTDVEAPISNDVTQTFSSVNLGASEYFVFAYPSRITDPSNWYDNSSGFGLSLNASSPATVSVTNANGFTEDYDVWVSNQILGPGAFQLRTT